MSGKTFTTEGPVLPPRVKTFTDGPVLPPRVKTFTSVPPPSYGSINPTAPAPAPKLLNDCQVAYITSNIVYGVANIIMVIALMIMGAYDIIDPEIVALLTIGVFVLYVITMIFCLFMIS